MTEIKVNDVVRLKHYFTVRSIECALNKKPENVLVFDSEEHTERTGLRKKDLVRVPTIEEVANKIRDFNDNDLTLQERAIEFAKQIHALYGFTEEQ